MQGLLAADLGQTFTINGFQAVMLGAWLLAVGVGVGFGLSEWNNPRVYPSKWGYLLGATLGGVFGGSFFALIVAFAVGGIALLF